MTGTLLPFVLVDKNISQEHIEKITNTFTSFSHGARVHWLKGLPFLSVSASNTFRILCRPVSHEEKWTFYVFGVLPQHNYQDAHKFVPIAQAIQKTGLQNRQYQKISLEKEAAIHFLFCMPQLLSTPITIQETPIILLDDDQNNIIHAITQDHSTAFINGIAGTGKTSIAQLLLQEIHRLSPEAQALPIVYLCPTNSLAQAQQRLYQNQREQKSNLNLMQNPEDHPVIFLSIKQFYERLDLIKKEDQFANFETFQSWYTQRKSIQKHHSLLETYKNRMPSLYAEFCLIGSQRLEEKTYVELSPQHTTVITASDRQTIYSLYQGYCNYLTQQSIKRIENMHITSQATPMFESILIDEAQLFLLSMLENIFKSKIAKKILMLGDLNQGPFYFKVGLLTSMVDNRLKVFHLCNNYRSSQAVIALGNTILKVQNHIIGGQPDKDTIPEMKVPNQLTPEGLSSIESINNIKEFISEIDEILLAKTIFIVQSDDQKQWLSRLFAPKTTIILRPNEIIGLEFKQVVLVNPISQSPYKDIFKKIKKHLPRKKEALQQNPHKPKDKSNAQLVMPYIQPLRALFLMITRAQNAIYIFDNLENPFIRMLRDYLLEEIKNTPIPEPRNDSLKPKPESEEDKNAAWMESTIQLFNNQKTRKSGLALLQSKFSDNPLLINFMKTLSKDSSIQLELFKYLYEIKNPDKLTLIIKKMTAQLKEKQDSLYSMETLSAVNQSPIRLAAQSMKNSTLPCNNSETNHHISDSLQENPLPTTQTTKISSKKENQPQTSSTVSLQSELKLVLEKNDINDILNHLCQETKKDEILFDQFTQSSKILKLLLNFINQKLSPEPIKKKTYYCLIILTKNFQTLLTLSKSEEGRVFITKIFNMEKSLKKECSSEDPFTALSLSFKSQLMTINPFNENTDDQNASPLFYLSKEKSILLEHIFHLIFKYISVVEEDNDLKELAINALTTLRPSTAGTDENNSILYLLSESCTEQTDLSEISERIKARKNNLNLDSQIFNDFHDKKDNLLKLFMRTHPHFFKDDRILKALIAKRPSKGGESNISALSHLVDAYPKEVLFLINKNTDWHKNDELIKTLTEKRSKDPTRAAIIFQLVHSVVSTGLTGSSLISNRKNLLEEIRKNKSQKKVNNQERTNKKNWINNLPLSPKEILFLKTLHTTASTDFSSFIKILNNIREKNEKIAYQYDNCPQFNL